MKKYALASATVLALLAAGCDKSDKNTGPHVVAQGEVVATVNGKPISRGSLEILSEEVGERRGGNNVPEDKLVEELIKRELLRQEVELSGMLKDPKLAAKIENAQRMLLSQAAAEQYISTLAITDDELKKEYDFQVGALSNAEYRARHILVEAEQTAKDIIAKLDKGEKFEALAKKFSVDPGSKDKGGELGWFNPQQMVPPFAQAVIALKNGERTKTPVQSQFGWHVIEREESRDKAPPAFDTVKEQLTHLVQTKKLQQHITELKAKAKIENKVEAKADAPATPSVEKAAPAQPAAQPAPAAPQKP